MSAVTSIANGSYRLPDGGMKPGAPLDLSACQTPHLLQRHRIINLDTTFRLFEGYLLHKKIRKPFSWSVRCISCLLAHMMQW
jgi:hypothetical protein